MSTQGQHEAPEMPEPVEISIHGPEHAGCTALLAPGRFGVLSLFSTPGIDVARRYAAAPGGLVINYTDGWQAFRLGVLSVMELKHELLDDIAFAVGVEVLNYEAARISADQG